MTNTITSVNMNLPIPIPGVDPGPDYAQNIATALGLVDAHNHSSGQGVQITPAGLNINSDLSFIGSNATSLRSARFAPQASSLTNAADVGCLSVVGNELFYNDIAGNRFALTNNGSVVGTSGSIQGLVSPASAIYSSGTQTIVFLSAAVTSANLDAGFLILRNAGASSLGLTLQAPTIGSNYAITLPQLPGSSGALVTMSNTGVQGTTAPDTTTIQNSGGVLSVVPGGIGIAQIAATAGLCPPGAILSFGGTVPPTGWLLCDGSSYLRATYPALFTAIGTAWGTADSTHFNVPMGEGFFLRGYSAASGNDPDASSRTANNPGGATGNNVGTQQADQYASHAHSINAYDTENAGGGNVGWAGNSAGPSCVTNANGGDETRPKNISVLFIIKT